MLTATYRDPAARRLSDGANESKLACIPASNLWSFVLLCAIGACAGTDNVQAPAFQVRDSAGVQLIDNVSSRPEPRSLPYDESLRIGGDETAPTSPSFFGISNIVLDESGSIYVADRSLTVRVFTEDGALVRTMGGRGDGPGEFQSIIGLIVHRDTAVVFDFTRGRLTTFDGDGNVVDTGAGEATVRSDSWLAQPYAKVDDGWIFRVHHRRSHGPGLHRDTLTLRHVRDVGAALQLATTWDTAITDTQPIRLPREWIYTGLALPMH